jgi:glycosyltransferase involved in cell wall biosynthesis
MNKILDDISLIITTYNKPEALELVLNSVSKQVFLPFEVIIADDGSDKLTEDIVKRYQKILPVEVVHSWQENKGFRVSMNRNNAVRIARGSYIIFIDGDLILDRRFVYDHWIFRKKGCFINGSFISISPETTWKLFRGKETVLGPFSKGIKGRFKAIYFPFFNKMVKGPQYTHDRIRGGQWSLWKDDYYLVNGYDEIYNGWGFEDSDMAYRVMNAGIKRLNIKQCAIAFHLFHEPSSKHAIGINKDLLKDTILTKRIKARIGMIKDDNELE